MTRIKAFAAALIFLLCLIFPAGGAYASSGLEKLGETRLRILFAYPNGGLFTEDTEGRCGFLDKSGKPAGGFIFDDYFLYSPDSGLTVLSINGLFGAVGNDFTEAVPFIYEDMSDFSGGFAVARFDGLFGVIDVGGKPVIGFEYKRIMKTNYDGVFRANNGNWGLMTSSGSWLVKPQYAYLGRLSEEMISFGEGLKTGFLDINGNVAIPAVYDDATFFVNGFASVQIGDKWAIIGLNGEKVTDYVFDSPVFFDTGGYAEGIVEGEAVDVYKFGGKITAAIVKKYLTDDVSRFSESPGENMKITSRAGGVFVFESDEKYGICREDGEILLAAEYSMILSGSGNYIQAHKDGVWELYKVLD